MLQNFRETGKNGDDSIVIDISDFWNRYLGGSFNSWKQFLMTLELLSS